jgi:hypothetical protein
LDLLPVCMGDAFGLWELREDPVPSFVNGARLPAAAAFLGLPTFVAASKAPLSPPVYVLT